MRSELSSSRVRSDVYTKAQVVGASEVCIGGGDE